MRCTKLIITQFLNQVTNHTQNIENIWNWKYTILNFILKIYTKFGQYTKIQPITQWKTNSDEVDYFQITFENIIINYKV